MSTLLKIYLSVLALLPLAVFSQSHQSWSYNKSIYEVNVRQYTEAGTFAAFETHLERLQDMGVGILWFMPIHPIGEKNRLGSLGSYYSVKDYLAVNPEFGEMDDFKALVARVHDMGMYVIIDWVANHTAWDNPLTLTHPDWYSTDADGNFIPPPGTNWSDVIDLDYSQPELRQYMIDAMKFWVEQADIDGFRCDAASWVPLDFWKDAIDELRALKPEIFMLAEADGQQFRNAGFDMTYAWGYHGFGNGILNRLTNGTNHAKELADFISVEQKKYPGAHYRMYFTSNHDENSWHGTVFEQFGCAAESFAVLTCLLNGMPLIYSGQEAGLDKRLLFFDKDQIEWQEHPFAAIYSTLLHLKQENKALWNGESGGKVQRVMTSNNEDLFAFWRKNDKDMVFALFNLSANPLDVAVDDSSVYGLYRGVFTDDSVTFDSQASVKLAGWDYKVFEKVIMPTGVKADKASGKGNAFSQSFPNPFNLNTEIRFYLPRDENITVAVYNSRGNLVKMLYSEFAPSGFHSIMWDSRNTAGEEMASGAYFYRILSQSCNMTGNMILVK